jgi:hypothetical protein
VLSFSLGIPDKKFGSFFPQKNPERGGQVTFDAVLRNAPTRWHVTAGVHSSTVASNSLTSSSPTA